MTSDERQTEPQSPTMSDAVWPVVVLIGLISSTVILFGVDATTGPLQVALFLSAGFAALLAKKNGFTFEQLRAAAVSGVSSAMSAIFILLAVGALIGTWNMAGTIPTRVSFGVGLLSAKWFYVAAAVICAVVGMVTGSSWTTAGDLGVLHLLHLQSCEPDHRGRGRWASWVQAGYGGPKRSSTGASGQILTPKCLLVAVEAAGAATHRDLFVTALLGNGRWRTTSERSKPWPDTRARR